jgi:hypothetical protein
MPSQPVVRLRQRMSLPVAASLAVVCVALIVASSSVAATRAVSNTAAWCALVIQINTKFGAMKNKHYLSPTAKVSKAIIPYAVAHRAQILAVTPTVIKKAQSDELTYYAHLVASNYAPTTPFAPLTPAELTQLLNFQHAKCGITGP